jgi:uncharacterized protein YceK
MWFFILGHCRAAWPFIMKILLNFFALVASVFCSGCVSLVGRSLGDQDSNVYVGARDDVGAIKEGSWIIPVAIIDFPFSAALDTLLLPVDLAKPAPVENPLKPWKWLGWTSPNQAITDDYKAFIKTLPQGEIKFIMDSGIKFFEDGKGQRAVDIEIPLDGTYWNYALIYDNSNKRIKTVRFSSGHYRC